MEPKGCLILFQRLAAAFAIAALAGCGPSPEKIVVAPRDIPQTPAELNTVRTVFDAIQPRSVETNLEYCGYIVRDDTGRISATPARRGGAASCTPRWPDGRVDVLASYHTHGAFNPEYDSEIPSYEDMASDILEAVDGYVATPSGRVWHIDAARKETQLICGPRCVASDPTYIPGSDDIAKDRYTLDELSRRGHH